MTTDTAASAPDQDDEAIDAMLVVAIELVVAIAVWGLLGLVVDLVLGIGPWLQFAGVIVGTMIGLVLARRRATSPASEDVDA